jgi:hypothetical protein
MAVPVRQMTLMGQERRLCMKNTENRRHADIGLDVMAAFPAPLVRQTRTQVARSADIRSSGVPTSSLNQIRATLQTAQTNPDSICHIPQRRARRHNENCWRSIEVFGWTAAVRRPVSATPACHHLRAAMLLL